MLSIGELSRVTQLTIKALRFYHEKGVLIPDVIDYDSKYRYYRSSAVEKAAVIKRLKDMGFSLKEIKKVLMECQDDTQVVSHVQEKLKEVEKTIREYQEMKQSLSLFLERSEQEKAAPSPIRVEKETIPDMQICSIRFKGKYYEAGYKFGIIAKKCGRYIKGSPFTLYYDGEYKEDDADIEACFEVKKKVPIDDETIACRELKGGHAVTLIHKGPYQELGRSYRHLFEYCQEQQLKTQLPSREQYLKGPGFIFRGNPKNYLTKLMILYH